MSVGCSFCLLSMLLHRSLYAGVIPTYLGRRLCQTKERNKFRLIDFTGGGLRAAAFRVSAHYISAESEEVDRF